MRLLLRVDVSHFIYTAFDTIAALLTSRGPPPTHTRPPQKFKLKGLTEEATTAEPYDGAAAYSLHHRARVMLTEVWARELAQDK